MPNPDKEILNPTKNKIKSIIQEMDEMGDIDWDRVGSLAGSLVVQAETLRQVANCQLMTKRRIKKRKK